MTNRERVQASFEHRQPDRTPYQIDVTVHARTKLEAAFGGTAWIDELDNCLGGMRTEAAGEAWREIRPDIWQDQFGVQWDRTVDKDIGVVCNQVVTKDTLDAVAFPDPHDPRRWEGYAGDVDALHAQGLFVTPRLGFSLFERAWTLYGMENLLVDMAADPAFVDRLLDKILEYNLAIIDEACAYDVDGFYLGDDWGSQFGLIMGSALWDQFIKPRVAAMYGAVRQRGKYVVIHSCGKVQELFPRLIDCGLHCFNPFQPEVMDPVAMKREFGDRLSFHGGISTQQTLPYGTPQQTRDEVRRLLDEVGKDGGYIAAPAHAIPGDVDPANFEAMVDVLNNQ